MKIMFQLLLKYLRTIKKANSFLIGIINAPLLVEKGVCKMRSEIFENTLKEFDKAFDQELSLGLKLVHFDDNDKETETEYRKLSSFAVIKEE